MSYNESLNPRSNYPHMSQSEWDNAPFNEPMIPEKNFDLGVTVTLARNVKVCTNNYTPELDEESGCTYANTENTEWVKEYNEKCYTIPELLETLKDYVKQDLERYNGSRHKEMQLKEILEACDGWRVKELAVEEI